jgi:Spy/CpxP family protein refolding chaperone
MKTSMMMAIAIWIAGSGLVQAEEATRTAQERDGGRHGKREASGEHGRRGAPERHRVGGPIERLLKDPKAAAKLGMSSDQIADLKSQLGAIEAKEKELHASMQALGRKQMELLQRGDVERQVIYQIIDQLGDVRTQLAKCRIDRLLAVQAVMTDEQQAKLRDRMHNRRREKGGRRRPDERRPGGPEDQEDRPRPRESKTGE